MKITDKKIHGEQKERFACHPLCASLFENIDEKYAQFDSRLLPNVEPARIAGIRVPVIREYASRLRSCCSDSEIEEFLSDLPHRYLEEDILHALLLNTENDERKLFVQLEVFLQNSEGNWKMCDTLNPKAFKKALKIPEFEHDFRNRMNDWIDSEYLYQARFAIRMFMVHYLKERYDKRQLIRIALIQRPEYYFEMIQGWYLAEAAINHFDHVYDLLQSGKVSEAVFRKTVSKSLDSFRISENHKEQLRELREFKKRPSCL